MSSRRAAKQTVTAGPLVLFVLILCAGTAGAETSLSVRNSNRFVADAGYDLLSSDDLFPQLEFNAARRILSVWPGHLWVEGSYLLDWRKNKIFGGRATAWSYTHSFMVGARFSVPVFSWLEPMARVSMGVVVGGLDLKSNLARSQNAEAWDAAFCGQALGGIELKIPRVSIFKRVTAGIVVEGGYTFATDLEFHAEPSVDEDLRLISQTGTTLGSLDLSGPMVVVGAVVQF